MSLHPIFVHFPIALLTVYAVFECIRSKRFMEVMHAFHVKAVLVILGSVGSIFAYATGPDQAARSPLGHMHQNFATITLVVFAIIALAYLIQWWKPNKYSGSILRPGVIIPLAIIGLIAVTMTGALGGALVYGTHFDPVFAPIFQLLGVY